VVPADLEKLAYESALRALDKQERVVEELRARAGLILGASSLAVSLLGGQGLGRPGHHGLVLVALVCFVASVGAAIVVLVPNDGFTFSPLATEVIEGLFEFRGDRRELYRQAADALERLWERNDAIIHRASIAFSIAAAALCVEVVSLALLLSGTLI
jgi:hypothetical protein